MPTVPHTCRICGAQFEFPLTEATRACPACGAVHGRPETPRGAAEGWESWLARANAERAACDFDHAEADYRHVLGVNPKVHEALWGLLMCKYGVEYVKDPVTRELRPTLHFLERTPISDDGDYRLACACAPADIRSQYQADAAYIEQVQRGVTAAAGGEPVDVFLCYKGSAAAGKGEAAELRHASALHRSLEKMGYRVFFAHESLQYCAAGANYEAEIFHALYSARVMLVVCSDPRNLDAAWVRSEWRRFFGRINRGESCCIIPLYYDGCDPYELPEEFVKRGIQGVKMGELDSLDKLRANLQRVISRPEPAAAPASEKSAAMPPEALLPVEYELTNREWDDAARTAGELIKRYPTCARLYLYRLLAKMKLCGVEELAQTELPYENEVDWKWAMRHANEEEKKAWTGVLEASQHVRKRREDELTRLRDEARREDEARRQAEEKRRAEEAAERNAVRRLLKKKKWKEAGQRAHALAEHADKPLLQWMAEVQIPSEEEIRNADPEKFKVPSYEAACRRLPQERLEQLREAETAANTRVRRRQGRAKLAGIIFAFLVGAVVAGLVVRGTYVGNSTVHYEARVFSLAAALVAYIYFAVACVKDKNSSKFLLTVGGIALTGASAAVLLLRPEGVWIGAGIAVLALLMAGRAIGGFSFISDAHLRATMPISIWLLVHYASPIVLRFAGIELFHTLYRESLGFPALLAVVLLTAVLNAVAARRR